MMKSFSTVYNERQADAVAKKRLLVEQQHAQIVAAVKKEYGVSSFATLNESDKAYYKSLINCMWDKHNGLNEKGVRFVNEAIAPLTKESTPEQIKKCFQREVNADIASIVACINSQNPNCTRLSTIKSNIEKDLGKKISARDVKEWTMELVQKHLVKGLRAVKF